MVNANPFAPPQAIVRDVHEENVSYQAVNAFSYKGRIGRLRFLAYSVTAYLAVIAVAAVLGALSALLHLPMWVASVLPLIPYFVVICMLSIQRSHDMDWSGWMAFLALIPLVGLVWLFKGGSKGANRYGDPTPPNTAGVRILALFLPAIAIIGIAAAVAIPAYSDYSKRVKAKQAQSLPAPAPTAVPAS